MDGQQFDVNNTKTPHDLYASEMNEEKIRNIVSQISPSNQIEEIDMRLRGYKHDFRTGAWVKIYQGLENENMINRYTTFLSSILNTSVTLCNLSPQQINNIMRKIIKWVAFDLDAHSEEYGITNDYAERERIGNILLCSVFFTLKRAENGGEAKRFWNSLQLTENSSQQAKGEGENNVFKFWKR